MTGPAIDHGAHSKARRRRVNQRIRSTAAMFAAVLAAHAWVVSQGAL